MRKQIREKPVDGDLSARALHRSVSSQLDVLCILTRVIVSSVVCGVGLVVFGRRFFRCYIFERRLVLAAALVVVIVVLIAATVHGGLGINSGKQYVRGDNGH